MKLLADRYELEAPAGAGGGGSVFLAHDAKLPGRRCAVKLVRLPAGPESALARHEVLAEASLLARLDHAGLPRVSDIIETDDGVGIVMDYVPGDNLLKVVQDARRRGRPIDEVHLIRWAEALCDVLGYLHGQSPSVLHRDIKPANVKLTPDGELKLVDFGLAIELPAENGATRTVHRTGGTFAYQALEQAAAGSRQDERTDLYGLGATLYHLCAGHAPLSAHERFLSPERWRPLADERPDLSACLATAVDEAMALHPQQRPADVEAFRRLLRRRASRGNADRSPWGVAWVEHRRIALAVALLWFVAVVATMVLR